jgi:PPP family 3-phenylpropionic acid transporter
MSQGTATGAAPPHYVLRMSAFFAGYFVFGGVFIPFFPVWLQARGLSEVEIANVIAIPVLVRVFLTPFAGMYADRAPNRRFATITFTLPPVLIFLFAWPATGFWSLLFSTGIAFILLGLALPSAEALALTGVRRFNLDYGRMRLSGSVAFIVANLGSGALLGFLHPEAIFWLLLAALISSAAVAFFLPVTPPQVRALDDAQKPDTRPAWRVLGNPGFLVLMLASGLVQASHTMLYSFGSIYWTANGYSGLAIGSFWAIGVGCEITLFIWSAKALRRFGAYGLLVAGTAAAIVRWSLFPLEPGFIGFFSMQALHGLTFGATYLGTQHLIARIVPDEMTASAQGIYAMLTGVLMAAGTSLAGPIYHAYGVDGFLLMTPVAALALALLIPVRRYATRPS